MDILREISSSLHLLLHEETENGGLEPCYVSVSPKDVNTLAGKCKCVKCGCISSNIVPFFFLTRNVSSTSPPSKS